MFSEIQRGYNDRNRLNLQTYSANKPGSQAVRDLHSHRILSLQQVLTIFSDPQPQDPGGVVTSTRFLNTGQPQRSHPYQACLNNDNNGGRNMRERDDCSTSMDDCLHIFLMAHVMIKALDVFKCS